MRLGAALALSQASLNRLSSSYVEDQAKYTSKAMSVTPIAVLFPVSMWMSLLSQTAFQCAGVNSGTQKDLTFMFITSFGRFGFNSSGTFPAVDIALEMINSRSDILQGYNLVYDGVVRDSEVSHFLMLKPVLISSWALCSRLY